METNYKYSALPKAGDRVVIIDAFDSEKLNGRTGIVLRKSKTRTYKLVDVVGIGPTMIYFKGLYKLSL